MLILYLNDYICSKYHGCSITPNLKTKKIFENGRISKQD